MEVTNAELQKTLDQYKKLHGEPLTSYQQAIEITKQRLENQTK